MEDEEQKYIRGRQERQFIKSRDVEMNFNDGSDPEDNEDEFFKNQNNDGHADTTSNLIIRSK